MKPCPVLFLLCLFGSGLQAGPVQTIAPDAILDKFRTLAPENERLAGIYSNRLRANMAGLLEHIDVNVLTAGYIARAEGGKSGELPGRFLQAAAHAYEYRQSVELRAQMDRIAAALAKAQEKDGYLGIAAGDDRFNPADLRVQRANLLGLLAYYQATGEESAYTVSQKVGDLLATKLKGLEPQDTAVTAGLAEPLVILYRYTAEPAYLELAKTLAGERSSPDAALADRLAQYVGLAELYRASGEERFFREAVRGWTALSGERANATGVPIEKASQSEVSSCVTALWLKLSLELMRLTGLSKYGDSIERTIYNQLLAGQDGRTGDVCAATPESGRKTFLGRLAASASPCALAQADGLALISQTLWGRWGTGIALNSYNPGRGSFQLRRRALIQMYVESSYPNNGDILLHVEPSRNARFPLRLRVPEWAETFAADFGNSSHLIGRPGEFLIIEREWKRGDIVRIKIDMRAQTVADNSDDKGRFAIRRGPEMLALNRSLNPNIKDAALVSPQLANGANVQLTGLENKMPRMWAGDEAYALKCIYEGKPQTVTLVPFADANDFTMWFGKLAPGS